MGGQRVLVISFSDLGRDPRVSRQVNLLAESCEVTAAALGAPDNRDVSFVRLEYPPRDQVVERSALGALLFHAGRVRNVPRRLTRIARALLALVGPRAMRESLHEQRYWSGLLVKDALAKVEAGGFDVVIANDLETLPLAVRLAGDAPVVFDAHEYAPREYDNSALFRIVERPFREYLARRYIPLTRGMTTVCDGIAREYHSLTGVRPDVVLNAPPLSDREPRPTARGGPIRIIHHGLAARVRRIDAMIDMMASVDSRFTLDLMLVESEPGYLAELKARAAGDPRITFRDTVPMKELVSVCAEYDVGLFLLPPTNFNYLHALPNKFFEFVQARLAIAIGPSPEMSRLVKQFGMGVVANDFEPASLGGMLNGLDEAKLDDFKRATHRAAPELCAEASAGVFRKVVAAAIASRTGAVATAGV